MAPNVAPDGGWGWMIVLANAVSNIVTMSIVTSFGLIFRHHLAAIGMSATSTTTITSVASICNMSMGFVTAPLLKTFGCRRIAVVGGVLFVAGLTGTAFADTFAGFVAAYGVLASAGTGLATAAFSLATLTYFAKRRSRAVSLTMTLSGLGPIVYPPMIVAAFGWFELRDCVLLLAALSGHIFVAAALLQPVERHQVVGGGGRRLRRRGEANADDGELGKKHASSNPSSEDEADYLDGRLSDNPAARMSDHSLSASSKHVRFHMPAHIIAEPCGDASAGHPTTTLGQSPSPTKRGPITAWLVHQFDLDLLADRRFVNIIAGMAIATFAEINFSVLTPFMLSEMGFSNGQMAQMLSGLAMVDICARFAAPFVADRTRFGARVVYMVSLAALVGTRMALLCVGTFGQLMALAAAMGVAKGVRTVYMILVIPQHVRVEQLAAAGGIRMVANMAVLLVLGPLVGFIRDQTGDYALCIVFMNGLTCLSLLMWSCEMVYVWYVTPDDRTETPIK